MTLILAQKLVSVKLNKGEYEKIKWFRSNNTEKQLKVIGGLKEIINKQVPNKTCRLCLKPGKRHIFERVQEFDLVTNIKYILGIEVTENDGKPQHVCRHCESTLRIAVDLKQTAETTQWRLQQELEMVADMSPECEVQQESQHGGHFLQQGAKIVRVWTCGKCRRTFESHDDFIEHEQLPKCRPKRNYYVCETCGRKQETLTKLTRHRLVHTEERAFPCARCPHRARSAHALALHERAHAGARPAACKLCPATFVTSSNLSAHMRKHRPPAFHCPVCARSFRFKEALHNHIATQHSTDKPHICKICGDAFATRKMFCRHERRVHNRPKLRSSILGT